MRKLTFFALFIFLAVVIYLVVERSRSEETDSQSQNASSGFGSLDSKTHRNSSDSELGTKKNSLKSLSANKISDTQSQNKYAGSEQDSPPSSDYSFTSKALQQLVSDQGNFDMDSLMSLTSSAVNVENAIYQVSDKASYQPELGQVSESYKTHLSSRLSRLSDGHFVENLACDFQYCIALIQSNDSLNLNEDFLNSSEEFPIYTSFSTELSEQGVQQMAIFFSISKQLEGVEHK